MLKLDLISNNPAVSELLAPKKEIFDLVNKINGSMLELHKNLKTSKDIEVLAQKFYNAEETLREIRNRGFLNLYNVKSKISKLKNMQVETDDFI